MKSLLSSSALIASLVVPLPTFAALPTGKIEFVTPTATVGPNDVIDIRMRLTIDASSSDLTFSSNPLTGFASADLPIQGDYYDPVTAQWSRRDFASFSGAFFITAYLCFDTFINACAPSANYSFEFWTSSQPGRPAIAFLDSFSLAAGASTEYVLGQYTPAARGAAAGTYSFYSTYLNLIYQGVDAGGNPLTSVLEIGETCPRSYTPECAFTRTVVAAPVPEPSTYAMMALGLLGVGLRLRRRSERFST
jgi:PEP-CTERM motif